MSTDDAGRLVGSWPEDLATASMALARRLAAGATLWCWSPRWPQHAEHVAVEFVHPVIVGKRALPAATVEGSEPVAALRTLVAPGDVILVVAGPCERGVEDVLRRAPAWGAETVWIGAGPRPQGRRGDHLLWFDGTTGEPEFTGAFVLAYHVLWELTHVCFEHPGLLKPGEGECDDGHCITCSDEGRLAEVVGAGSGALSLVRSASGLEDVDTTLVDPVEAGDLLLVHAGVAISRLDGEG